MWVLKTYICLGKMNQNIKIFLFCVSGILIFGRILIIPIKKITKLLINSILGGVFLAIINYIGNIFFDFYIGINIFTAMFVGLLGIPGVVVLILIKLFLIWILYCFSFSEL